MATVAVQRTIEGRDEIVWLWETLTETNADGAAAYMPRHSDRSVQVEGTFGGDSVSIEGSNDGTNWHVLHDPFGNLLTLSAAGLAQIAEYTRYVRPFVNGGTGVDVDVTLLAKGV